MECQRNSRWLEISKDDYYRVLSISKNEDLKLHFKREPYHEIMKSQKISWPSGQGPRNYIWATWAQQTCQTINPEP